METFRPDRPAALEDEAATTIAPSARAADVAQVAASTRCAMNLSEQPKSRREIEAIARELGLPVAQVAAQYAEEYARLEARAQVTHFLPVLVSRKLRASYHRAGALWCQPQESVGP